MMNFFQKKLHLGVVSVIILAIMFLMPNAATAQSSQVLRTKQQANAVYVPQIQAMLAAIDVTAEPAKNTPAAIYPDYLKLKMTFLNNTLDLVNDQGPAVGRALLTVRDQMKKGNDAATIDAIFNEVRTALGF